MDPDNFSSEDNALNAKSIPTNILPGSSGSAEVAEHIPFEVRKGTAPRVRSIPELPPESIWRRIFRIILLILEFAYTIVILFVLLLRYIKYFSLEYSIISTVVYVRDPLITYTTVMRAQIMFFFYREDLVNATSGIGVTEQYYVETIDLYEKCEGHYEYYETKSDANDLDSRFKGDFVKSMTCIVLVIILLCAITKLLLSRYIKEYDVPMVLKLHIKSKFAYEFTLYTAINVMIISFVGILIPLIALDYDNDCLISDIGYSVKGLYKSYYSLLICFISFIVPLLFSILYKYFDDNMRYACFILFWITLPAFLLVLASGHAIMIITYQRTRSNLLFFMILGGYIMLVLSCVITGTITIVEWLDFYKRKEMAERANVNIRPLSATATRTDLAHNP